MVRAKGTVLKLFLYENEINVPTVGAHAFPVDGIRRLGQDPPRGLSADWWVLTTANAAGTNGLTCLPKHGGARDRKFLVTHPMTDHCENTNMRPSPSLPYPHPDRNSDELMRIESADNSFCVVVWHQLPFCMKPNAAEFLRPKFCDSPLTKLRSSTHVLNWIPDQEFRFRIPSVMSRAILVTGGAGYVGSHTVAALLERDNEQDLEIVVVDNLINAHKENGQKKPEAIKIIEEMTNQTIQFYDVDIRDADALSKIFETAVTSTYECREATPSVRKSTAGDLVLRRTGKKLSKGCFFLPVLSFTESSS
ncbi:hypothetical protein evm_014504 [Chilo suppressalis]|nr:hypothetical protein evm_014504 [Chilo suppressalis]